MYDSQMYSNTKFKSEFFLSLKMLNMYIYSCFLLDFEN